MIGLDSTGLLSGRGSVFRRSILSDFEKREIQLFPAFAAVLRSEPIACNIKMPQKEGKKNLHCTLFLFPPPRWGRVGVGVSHEKSETTGKKVEKKCNGYRKSFVELSQIQAIWRVEIQKASANRE